MAIMEKGVQVLYLFVVLTTCLFSDKLASAANIDTELSRALEEVITSDELIISVRNIHVNKRRKYIETLFALEFPGTQQKLSVQLDRGNKKVVVHTKFNGDVDSHTFIMDNSTEDGAMKILLLDVKQRQNLEKAEVTLLVDCVARGSFKLAKKLRDAYTSMRNPQLYFSHEMKYEINVDSDLNIDDVMLQHGNCNSDMQATQPLKESPSNSIKLTSAPSGFFSLSERSDLPPPNPCDFNTECCSVKVTSFTETLTKLQEELRMQRSETQELIKIMKQCHACKIPGVEVCPAGYFVEGGICRPSSVCHADSCYPGVTCTDLGEGKHKCGPCPAGLTGDGRECRRLFCSLSPCYPGVLCRDLNEGYQCGACPEHFTGNGQTCWRLWCDLNPCYPGVECTSSIGSFKCGSCPAGFTGDGVRCKPITSITPCDLNPCFSGVECINVGGGYKCGPCPRDFTGDGIKCIPTTIRLPCDDNPCFDGVTCTNTGAGFICGPCPPDYTGDGIRCVRIHCDQEICSPSTSRPMPQLNCPAYACYPGVICDMSEKGPICGPCPDKMTGDGIHCKQIVTCSSYYCYPGVDCIDTSHGPKCGNCPEGYTGNGTACKRIFTCRDRPCFPGAECYDIAGEEFRCGKCPPGFTGNGVSCNRIFLCKDNPCYPGVSCDDTTEGAKCGRCLTGFIGDGISCTKVTTCRDQPCQPGSRCLPSQEHPYYKCESCSSGQTSDGIICIDIDECILATPCDPRVECHNINPGFYCDPCPAGYTGNVPHGTGLEYARQNNQYCVDIDECAHNNGGCPDICVNTQGSYRCIRKICKVVCTQNNITHHAISKRSSPRDIMKFFNQYNNCTNKCDKNRN